MKVWTQLMTRLAKQEEAARSLLLRDALCVIAALVLPIGTIHASELHPCGPLENAYGPFDYRTAPAAKKRLVESHHFNMDVETLRGGMNHSLPGGSIDYTLRAFPNHPRALLSTAKLGLREGRSKPTRMRYSVDCWFDRAFRFAPDDPMPYALYASYLARSKRPQEAHTALAQAEKLDSSDDPNLSYNVALGYIELGEHTKALPHAKRAYALGFPLQWVKNELVRAGVWAE